MNTKKLASSFLLVVLLSNFFSIGILSIDNYFNFNSNITSAIERTMGSARDSNSYSNYVPIEEDVVYDNDSFSNRFDKLNNPIRYDLGIGKEFAPNNKPTIINDNKVDSNSSSAYISKPYLGTTLSNTQKTTSIKTSNVFGEDDREEVQDLSLYPWRTICKLYITAQDGSQFVGSGAIIDEFHVLTCGHCVYLHGYGGWASKIEIVSGKDQFYEPYGHAFATNLRTYSEWINSEDEDFDFALITLDRKVGNFTGWMGRKTATQSDPIYTDVATTAGYPGDLSNGEIQYYTSGEGEDADFYNHYYKLDVSGGQSGSPVWTYDGGSRYIISIVAYSSSVYNFGPRLNQDKYDTLNTWLQDDASDPPNDSPDLANRGEEFYNFYPSIITGEWAKLNIDWDVNNIGTSTSQSFTVSYYLTRDSKVNSSDYLLGISNISAISPYNYTDVKWVGDIKDSIPPGQYYLGWVIDSTNQTTEIDESNNNIVIGSKKITILPRFLFKIEFWLIVIGSVFLVSVVFVIIWYKMKSVSDENKLPEPRLDN